MKKVLLSSILALLTTSVIAGECNYTPDKDQFSFGFTAYGFPDKSYDVKDNTFTEYQLSSESGKLLNASIDIKTASVDTTADPRNWDRSGEWPEPTLKMRNQNIINGLFKNFTDGESIKATISGITSSDIELSVTMNGVTKTVTMPYTVTDGVLNAKGTLDLADYNTDAAMQAFNAICSSSWHRGKTWTDVDIYFSVPVAESSCE